MTSCFCRRKHTELHHQSERIHDKSGVLDFAVLHAVDDAPGFHGPPPWRAAKKLHPMRASPLEELLDSAAKVWQRRCQGATYATLAAEFGISKACVHRRCKSTRRHDYARYGGSGIKVCPRQPDSLSSSGALEM